MQGRVEALHHLIDLSERTKMDVNHIAGIDYTQPAPDAEPIELSPGTAGPSVAAALVMEFIYEATGGASDGLARWAREACNAIVRGGDPDGLYMEELRNFADEAAGAYWNVGADPLAPGRILLAPAEYWESIFDSEDA